MLITPQTLRGIFVGYNTLFNKTFAEQKTQYARISTEVPSTTGIETYAWLGDLPGMREWVGDRVIKDLSASGYTIKNKDFELTVGIPRNVIEDDTIGLYSPNVQMLAQSAAVHPDKLVFSLLKSGFAGKCFDGQPFFSDAHKVGKATASNKMTAKLTLAAYIEARTKMMSLKNEEGEPLALIPDLLVAPPALEATARDILVADYINGTKNTMQGTAELMIAPRLAGADTSWFLMDTSRPLKPMIFQKRSPAKFVSLTNETDPNVFMKKEYLYGVDYRGNAGYGFWQMAIGSDGTT